MSRAETASRLRRWTARPRGGVLHCPSSGTACTSNGYPKTEISRRWTTSFPRRNDSLPLTPSKLTRTSRPSDISRAESSGTEEGQRTTRVRRFRPRLSSTFRRPVVMSNSISPTGSETPTACPRAASTIAVNEKKNKKRDREKSQKKKREKSNKNETMPNRRRT